MKPHFTPHCPNPIHYEIASLPAVQNKPIDPVISAIIGKELIYLSKDDFDDWDYEVAKELMAIKYNKEIETRTEESKNY
jgi:hypothetical protein